MIKKLENCLRVFDDSREEIYQEKDFVKIAVAGRHKKIHCIFVKHNLFQRSGRVLLTSIQHTLSYLSLHVMFSKLITSLDNKTNRSSFEIAIKKLLRLHMGIFFIDFDPQTSESLRFCSNITGPGPTIFYLPCSLAKETALTNEREKRAYTEALAKQKEKESFQKNFM